VGKRQKLLDGMRPTFSKRSKSCLMINDDIYLIILQNATKALATMFNSFSTGIFVKNLSKLPAIEKSSRVADPH
jgi:hypothetical protein